MWVTNAAGAEVAVERLVIPGTALWMMSMDFGEGRLAVRVELPELTEASERKACPHAIVTGRKTRNKRRFILLLVECGWEDDAVILMGMVGYLKRSYRRFVV
jgi:hypothetical protein